ncbi:hypothetical protein J7L29_02750 [Candidatus Bathyarchaeota archaeon]|nr:hypothetical protein [Candidatus Bathyarchaeota archaeon]
MIESAAYYWLKLPTEGERLKAFAERWRELKSKDPVTGYARQLLSFVS